MTPPTTTFGLPVSVGHGPLTLYDGDDVVVLARVGSLLELEILCGFSVAGWRSATPGAGISSSRTHPHILNNMLIFTTRCPWTAQDTGCGMGRDGLGEPSDLTCELFTSNNVLQNFCN